ncbi:MAG TPA: hypothetical protein VF800_24445 [Telluria sp.]
MPALLLADAGVRRNDLACRSSLQAQQDIPSDPDAAASFIASPHAGTAQRPRVEEHGGGDRRRRLVLTRMRVNTERALRTKYAGRSAFIARVFAF